MVKTPFSISLITNLAFEFLNSEERAQSASNNPSYGSKTNSVNLNVYVMVIDYESCIRIWEFKIPDPI